MANISFSLSLSILNVPKKVLAGMVCLVFLSLSSCQSDDELSAATQDELVTYLLNNTHQLTISNTSNFSEFDPIADHFQDKSLILLGENHASQFNDLLDTKLLIYLHQNHAVNYYLGETGYAMGKFINTYINTGDEALLSSLMNSWNNTFSYTLENKARLQRLKDYNLSLPENERITYVGIDVENQVGWAIREVGRLVELKGQIPTDIIINLSRVLTPSSRTYLNAVGLAQDLLADFESEDFGLIYRTFLGNDFTEIEFILNNLLAKAELDRNPGEFNSLREPKITENYIYINEKYPNAKYYGKWGLSHIWKAPVEGNYTTFVERLIFEDVITRAEVESLPVFYEDGYFASPSSNYEQKPITFSVAPPLLATEGFQALTIFDLNEADSPFYRTNELVEGRSDFTGSIISTAIKLKDSPASNKAFD